MLISPTVAAAGRSLLVRIECLRALATARRATSLHLRRSGIQRVLVVCYGNIYRSPFVEAHFAQRPIPGVEVRSAGLHPVGNRPSPPAHVTMSRRHGVDLAAHRSRVLGAGDLNWAQLIVLMDRHNWQSLAQRGVHRNRIVWLGALDGGDIEIKDPYGLDDVQAEKIVARLAACTERLAAALSSQPRT